MVDHFATTLFPTYLYSGTIRAGQELAVSLWGSTRAKDGMWDPPRHGRSGTSAFAPTIKRRAVFIRSSRRIPWES